MKTTKVIDKNYKKPVLFKAAMTVIVWAAYFIAFVVFTRNLGTTVAGYLLFAAIFAVLAPITVWLASKIIKDFMGGYRPSPKFVLYSVLAVAVLFLGKYLITKLTHLNLGQYDFTILIPIVILVLYFGTHAIGIKRHGWKGWANSGDSTNHKPTEEDNKSYGYHKDDYTWGGTNSRTGVYEMDNGKDLYY